VTASKRDQREERTFDRAVELLDTYPGDFPEVRRQLQAEVQRLRGKAGEDLDITSEQQLRTWWEQGLVRQVRLRAVVARPPIKETIADRQLTARERTKQRVPRTFDRAAELLKQQPGQFERVAAALGGELKARDLEPVDAEQLRAWWARGLQEPDGDGGFRQVRPPISDEVQNHIALREEQADAEAQTLRRRLKADTALNGLKAIGVLAYEQEHIRRLRATMAGADSKGVGLDKIQVALLRGIADDLEDAELSPEKKYEWYMRIEKMREATRSALASVAANAKLIGDGPMSVILGISMNGMPAGNGKEGQVADGDISVADLRQRALEVASYMEDLDRLPQGIESAIEAEVAAEG